MADPVRAVEQLRVRTPQGESGLLAAQGGKYRFGYSHDAPRAVRRIDRRLESLVIPSPNRVALDKRLRPQAAPQVRLRSCDGYEVHLISSSKRRAR